MKSFNTNSLYIYKFISQCMPIYAFYTILFIDRGKSVTDVAVLIALWSAFAILFEVPAGVLADRWNRRNMLAIGTVLKGLCFLIWFVSHTFFMFALGFFFWAVAGAFASGTEEGLIYDNLKSDGRETEFTKIYGRAEFFGNIGTVAGIVSAGVIAGFISVEATALISAGICFINAFFALKIREKNLYAAKTGEGNAAFFQTLKNAAVFIKGSRAALIFILFLVIFASLGGYLDEFDALIVNDLGFSGAWVSVVAAVRFIFIAIGDILAPVFGRKVSSIQQVFLINALACAALLAFALIWHIYAVLIFGVSFMVMAVTEILLVNALQEEIKEEGRATVMSFYSVGQNIGMICFALIYAGLAGMFSLQFVYVIVAVYGMVGVMLFYLLAKVRR